ncbi:MAG TPA: 4-alpha-glucanotransferase [Blastocatellia bacterium]|nr:4-alpha-glucanotransferase [Blastocatellia bacterium]
MTFSRASGILLHPTSLPGGYGIGDLGSQARLFLDFLHKAGQHLWQVLPLGPTSYGDSPYQCFSAFAGNPLLVSPEPLLNDGLLERSDLESPPPNSDRVDFGAVIGFKHRILERAYSRFSSRSSGLTSEFEGFCSGHAAWLDDYAMFRALKEAHGGKGWHEWEPNFAKREASALASAAEGLRERILAEKFFQWLFFRQWLSLKAYAREREINIVGDAPIFAAMDSADVWTNPDMFKLDKERRPIVVAGVPPDYFSATGQYWGNPVYNWKKLRATGFQWWIDRLRAIFTLVDLVRIDHFRGFAATWEIPAEAKTAEGGGWVEVPGRELFKKLKATFENLPIIAEDLGVITPDVEALRDEFGLPGMRILQFAFSSDSRNHDLPHNYIPNSVVYTGTHDNDTTVGWFRSKAGKGSTRSAEQIKHEREYCLKYLDTRGREINWDFIRAALSSTSNTAIVPLQDVLGLDSSARMNLPASDKGNWNWRAPEGSFGDELAVRLRELAELYGR